MADRSTSHPSPRHYYVSLGTKIREARLARELTQAALAEQIGISRASVANMERGEQIVSAQMLARLSVVLKVELAELMPDPHEAFEAADLSPEVVKSWPEAPEVAKVWMDKIIAGASE
jgi:transcriptional regulator with XRE-family HTH domain